MSPKMAGTPNVVILNARPRTCSRYSRLAISNMLRIGSAPHGLDEDLFERRLHHFKAINHRPRGSLAQQLLRVAVFLESNLSVAGEIFRFGNLRAVQKIGVAFKLDDHMIALVTGLDVAHPARQDCLTFVDKTDGIAELLH